MFRRHAFVIVNPAVIPAGHQCESGRIAGVQVVPCLRLAVAAARVDGVLRFVCIEHVYSYIPGDEKETEAI